MPSWICDILEVTFYLIIFLWPLYTIMAEESLIAPNSCMRVPRRQQRNRKKKFDRHPVFSVEGSECTSGDAQETAEANQTSTSQQNENTEELQTSANASLKITEPTMRDTECTVAQRCDSEKKVKDTPNAVETADKFETRGKPDVAETQSGVGLTMKPKVRANAETNAPTAYTSHEDLVDEPRPCNVNGDGDKWESEFTQFNCGKSTKKQKTWKPVFPKIFESRKIRHKILSPGTISFINYSADEDDEFQWEMFDNDRKQARERLSAQQMTPLNIQQLNAQADEMNARRPLRRRLSKQSKKARRTNQWQTEGVAEPDLNVTSNTLLCVEKTITGTTKVNQERITWHPGRGDGKRFKNVDELLSEVVFGQTRPVEVADVVVGFNFSGKPKIKRRKNPDYFRVTRSERTIDIRALQQSIPSSLQNHSNVNTTVATLALRSKHGDLRSGAWEPRGGCECGKCVSSISDSESICPPQIQVVKDVSAQIHGNSNGNTQHGSWELKRQPMANCQKGTYGVRPVTEIEKVYVLESNINFRSRSHLEMFGLKKITAFRKAKRRVLEFFRHK